MRNPCEESAKIGANVAAVKTPQEAGRVIREARENLGLTKRAAARAAGISESRWRQIESGVQKKNGREQSAVTKPETLLAIAKAVGIEPSELLEPHELSPLLTPLVAALDKGEVIDVSDFSENERRLIEAFLAGLRASRKVRVAGHG